MSVPTVATMMPVRCSIPCQDVGVPGASVGNARSASPPAVIRYPVTATVETAAGRRPPSANTA